MKFNLDRECPECEEMSLIELTGTKWKCQNPECGEIFEDSFLNESEE